MIKAIYRKLTEEVNVVFHCAATIKFDEDLTKSVSLNVVSVFTILKLCKQMKKLQVCYGQHKDTFYRNAAIGSTSCLNSLL